MPITYWTFLLATLAIAGIFPFAGFFSKDEILFHSLVDGKAIYWAVATIAAFITAFYMFRAVFMTFLGKSRVDHDVLHHVHESPPLMTVPLMILAGLSVVGGFVGIPLIEGGHVFREFLSPSITPVAHHAAAHPTATFEVGMMLLSMTVAGLGIYVAYKFYILKPELPTIFTEKFRTIYDLVYNKYYVDEIYDTTVVEPIKVGSNFLWNVVDAKGVDGVVNGSAGFIAYLSAHFRKLETGFLQNYALAILLGMVVITGYLIGR